MHPKLEEYLQGKYKERWEEREKKKNELLMREGLYELVPTTKKDWSQNYENTEERWDKKAQEYRYFRRIPIKVTDEEYARIKEVCKKQEVEENENTVATVLMVIAWIIYIAGFIMGISNAVDLRYDLVGRSVESDFSWMVAIEYWVEAFVNGTLLLGFAEIIKLLDQIKKKK